MRQAFETDSADRTDAQSDIVLSCGASGLEVKEAFETPGVERSPRQQQIVKVVTDNGAATSEAWRRSQNNEALTAWQANAVAKGTAAGAATAGAWERSENGEELTAWQANTVAKQTASGTATAGAWEHAKNGEELDEWDANTVTKCIANGVKRGFALHTDEDRRLDEVGVMTQMRSLPVLHALIQGLTLSSIGNHKTLKARSAKQKYDVCSTFSNLICNIQTPSTQIKALLQHTDVTGDARVVVKELLRLQREMGARGRERKQNRPLKRKRD